MSDLPTKVGPYYWRESEVDEWIAVHVVEDCDVPGHEFSIVFPETYARVDLAECKCQLKPIPTADELVELQAAKKAVDGLMRLVDDVYEWRQHIPGPEFCELRADIQALGEYATIIRKAKR